MTAAAPVVRASTFQDPAVLDALAGTGRARCDGRRIERSFREPYRWMRARVAARAGGHAARYPMWLWVIGTPTAAQLCPAPYGSRCRPGRWCSHRLTLSDGDVQLEFSIPPERLVLSDFDTWHHVLNTSYLPTAAEEARLFAAWDAGVGIDDPAGWSDWERRARRQLAADDPAGRWLSGKGNPESSPRLAPELRAELEASWERCLLDPAVLPARRAERTWTQACTGELRASELVRFRRFRADPAGRMQAGPWQQP